MKSKVIAITGGIGSGKSVVTKYLQSLGYATIDCDTLAKEIATRSSTIDKTRQLLGDEYIINGQLNRKAIRNKVFADEKLLQQYNAIFFDEVKILLDERIASMGDNKYVFVEISVFDAFDYPWDSVWLIEADEEIRIARATARDVSQHNVTKNIASRQRICSRYSVKLINNGTIEELERQVDNALKLI